MASKSYNMQYVLGAKVNNNYSKAFKNAESIASKSMKNVAKIATAAVGAIGVGSLVTNSTKDFIAFENNMNEVYTLLPNISQDAMDKMSEQAKKASVNMGVLPEETVPALYQALSAGVPEGSVFDFLESANKAAVGGVASLETAVDGLTTVVNSYGDDVIDVQKASDLMFTTVKLGKTDFSQLSSSLYNVLPSANAANVSFENVSAALAVMTSQGVPTSAATTKIRGTIDELSKANTKASNTFEKLSGKSFKEFMDGGGNLQEALQLLEQHANATGIGINDLFSSTEAGGAALALTGKGTESFTAALLEMEEAAGATDSAFETMEQGLARKIEKLKSRFAVFKLNIGGIVAGALLKLFEVAEKVGNYFKGAFAVAVEKAEKVVNFFKGNIVILKDKLKEVFENNEDTINRFTEKFSNMSGSFEETFQKISDVATPILEWLFTDGIPTVSEKLFDMLDGAINVYEYISSNWANIEPFITGIAISFGALKAAMLVYKGVTVVVTTVQAAFNAVMAVNPIGLVTLAIGGLIGAGITLYNNWDIVKAKANELWEKISTVFTNIKDTVIGAFKKIEPFVIGLTISWGSYLAIINSVTVAKNALKVAKLGLNKAMKIGETLTKGLTVAQKAWNKVINVTSSLKKGMITKISTFYKALKSGVVTKKLATLAQLAWNKAMSLNPIGVLVTAIGVLIGVGILLYKNWDTVKAKTYELWNSVKDFANGIAERFPFIGEIISFWSGYINEQIENVKQIFSGVIEFVSGVFTADWEKAWQGVQNIFGGIFGGLEVLIKAPLNGVITLVNGVIERIGTISLDIPDWVPKWGGESIGFDLKPLPMLAVGSDNSPNTFIAGEAGAELITNKKGSKVFTALETGKIFDSINKIPYSLASNVKKGLNNVINLHSKTENIKNLIDVDDDDYRHDGVDGGDSYGDTNNISNVTNIPSSKSNSNFEINYNPSITIYGDNANIDELKKLLAKHKAEIKQLVKDTIRQEENRKMRLSNA